jgi:hypothetical protein
MHGIRTFRTLVDALRAGYCVHERTDGGYLVRTRSANGWAIAIVTCSPPPHRAPAWPGDRLP